MVDRVTSSGAVEYAPVAYTSPLPGLVDLFKYFAGTQTSGSTSGTVSQQGQTAALEALIAQMADPASLENLVSSLFQKGAAQVPELTKQFANATGTRTTGNNMLGLSLAELNQSLAQAIAQAAVTQTNNAAQAAAKLGEINKVQNTSGQQQQKTGAAPGAAAKGLLTIGAGYGLNKLGKSSDNTAATGATSPTTPILSGTGVGPSAPIDVVSGVQAGLNPGVEVGTTSAFPTIESFNIDIPTIDFSSPAQSFGSNVGGDFGAGDFGSGAEFDFDYFGFADGGLVAEDPRRRRTAPAFFNSVRPGAPAALDFEGIGARNSQIPPIIVINSGGGGGTENTGSVDSESTGTGDSTSATTDSPGNVNAQGSLASGLTAGVLSGNPITGLVVGLGNFFMKGLIDAIFSPPAATPEATVGEEVGPPTDTPDAMAGGLGAPDSMGAPSASDETGNTGEASGTDSSSSSDAGAGTGADSSASDAGFADGGVVPTKKKKYADGGEIKAQDKKHTQGIDLIPIKATAGEYVLPVDTVELIGIDVLDEIVAATHSPLRGETR